MSQNKADTEMTREQIEQAAIKKLPYSDEECSDSNYTLGKNVGFKRGFIAGAEYALSHQWISVCEALPELMERVLVAYYAMNRISICIMKRIPHDTADPDNGKWHWSLVNHKEDVIAWMPIPKFETK